MIREPKVIVYVLSEAVADYVMYHLARYALVVEAMVVVAATTAARIAVMT